MKAESLLVLTTCAGAAEADRLAALLVEQRLAACVNAINGIASTYRWQDAIERSEESLLVIKTTQDRYPAVANAIREQSSYELPEVLAIPISAGLDAYVKWIAESVAEQGAG